MSARAPRWQDCEPLQWSCLWQFRIRTEGMGVRAAGRSFGKSHSTILRWERRLATQASLWSPPAPDGADVTLEGDEVYTRCAVNVPPL